LVRVFCAHDADAREAHGHVEAFPTEAMNARSDAPDWPRQMCRGTAPAPSAAALYPKTAAVAFKAARQRSVEAPIHGAETLCNECRRPITS